MPPSAVASGSLQSTFESEDYLTPRRIRHITGVQIRNFTPFPVRDSFTSALSLPLEQSHFATSGITDDLASVLSKKRPRKVSTNSTATRRSTKQDNGLVDVDVPSPAELKGKLATTAPDLFPNTGPVSMSPSNVLSFSYKTSHSLRGRRRRTSSVTSFGSGRLAEQSNGTLATFSGSSFLPDHSQAALQKVIHSRLIETFVTISLPSRINPAVEPAQVAPKSLRSAPTRDFPSRSRMHIRPPPSSQQEGALRTTLRASHPDSAPPTRTSFKVSDGSKGESQPSLSQAKRLDLDALGTRLPPQRIGKMAANSQLETEQEPESEQTCLIYVSPTHRPSTNPFFAIDARSGCDFPHGVDTSGQILKIEVWGRVSFADKGVDQQTEKKVSPHRHFPMSKAQGWKMLEAWDFSLSELRPLADSIDTGPSILPSNTLLVTLSPPGQVFYLPRSSPTPRTPSPSAGYTSDPESDIRKAKQSDEMTGQAILHDEILYLSHRRRRRHLPSTTSSTAKTATWQELFKWLVTVQSLILDNETSLNEVIYKLDKSLENDHALRLRREISEKQVRIDELHQHNTFVFQECEKKKQEIIDRSEQLKRRSELLALAKRGIENQPVIDSALAEERRQLETLHQNISSMRTSLLSILTMIFPIELYSPPDLLFTILDVPLPIPLTATDPAPPLTMAEHKEVTEESVATALGYVAQVLQILAAYLGRNLIYPVTCIGSRSLIRDSISAMVGPRMFPLFSKGVDTYRFEYGVFLLNKNIEMFMSERDLRALDIRHTLPNLKNLLLTLSHDPSPGSNSHSIKPPYSPMSMDTGLKTPSREASPGRDDTSTPRAIHIQANRAEGITPTASGATTPTTAGMADDPRKSKSFLGFVPFGDFLRSRYPSTSQSSDKGTLKLSAPLDPMQDGRPESDDLVDADEDDRTTIHGISLDGNDASLKEAAERDEGRAVNS